MIAPTKDLKEIQIDPLDHQVTELGTSLSEFEEKELVSLLKRSLDLFTFAPSNMSDMDTRVVCHCLVIGLIVKPVSQRKHKVGEGKRAAIDEEV